MSWRRLEVSSDSRKGKVDRLSGTKQQQQYYKNTVRRRTSCVSHTLLVRSTTNVRKSYYHSLLLASLLFQTLWFVCRKRGRNSEIALQAELFLCHWPNLNKWTETKSKQTNKRHCVRLSSDNALDSDSVRLFLYLHIVLWHMRIY